MTLLYQAILPLLLSFLLAVAPTLQLQQDIQQNLSKLQNDSRYYISDNTSLAPSLQTVVNDLQLFALAANIDLTKARYTSSKQGPHLIEKWEFEAGEITSIYQIQSRIHLDTLVTQRYLDNRRPTQHRVTNDFEFRTYAISTKSTPAKLFYLAEADQGLLEYKVGGHEVQIGYADKKEGLVNVLPQLARAVNSLLPYDPQ